MAIEFRRLTEDDLELVMEWRMREDITKMMFTDVNLTIEGQRKWFEKVKNSDSEIRWVIWNNNVPIGVINILDIDKNNMRCESGWYIAEKKDLSFKQVIAIQRNLFDYVFEVLGLNRLYAFVMDNNIGVPRMLEICGYKKEGLLRQHVIKNGEAHDVTVVGITKNEWLNNKKEADYEKIVIE